MTDKKLNKKKMSLTSKIFTGVLSAVIFLLLAFQLIGFISSKNNYNVPNYFGYQTMVVLTDSMEPTLDVKEAIFVKKVSLDSIKASTSYETKDGDIISFYKPTERKVITHRVVEVITNDDGSIDFYAIGDNLQADTCPVGGCDPIRNRDFVKGKDVLGVVVGQSKPFGFVYSALSNPFVILGVVILPLLFVFASSIKDIFVAAKMSTEEETSEEVYLDEFEAIKQEEKMKILIEMEKEKIREEMNNEKE